MELCKYYSLYECYDKKIVKRKLGKLEKEGKIEYSIDGDKIKIEDIDLQLNEINELINFFEKNDVVEYPYGFDDEDYDLDDEYNYYLDED
ncbi:MAG: hypothetical protein M0R46_16390 [Candidatus Muirbacterium halophilum]|nr:hypothetical protein [Candidatus Muirbacterium halophilum]